MGEHSWRDLAEAQAGLLSRRQLRDLGVTESALRHHIALERWAHRSSNVVSTTTGPLSLDQRLWLGVLHGGPTAMVGGLHAAQHLPAVLMFASRERHLRTALGAVTATVQQRRTTAERLLEWVELLAPLRRARQVRELLGDVAAGRTRWQRWICARRVGTTAYSCHRANA